MHSDSYNFLSGTDNVFWTTGSSFPLKGKRGKLKLNVILLSRYRGNVNTYTKVGLGVAKLGSLHRNLLGFQLCFTPKINNLGKTHSRFYISDCLLEFLLLCTTVYYIISCLVKESMNSFVSMSSILEFGFWNNNIHKRLGVDSFPTPFLMPWLKFRGARLVWELIRFFFSCVLNQDLDRLWRLLRQIRWNDQPWRKDIDFRRHVTQIGAILKNSQQLTIKKKHAQQNKLKLRSTTNIYISSSHILIYLFNSWAFVLSPLYLSPGHFNQNLKASLSSAGFLPSKDAPRISSSFCSNCETCSHFKTYNKTIDNLIVNQGFNVTLAQAFPPIRFLKQNNLPTLEQNVEITATLDPLMLLEARFRLLGSSLNRVSAIYE